MLKVVLVLLLPLAAVAQPNLKDLMENGYPRVRDYGDQVVKSAYPALESLGKKALPTLQNVARSPEGTQLLLTALPVVQGLAEKSGFSEELSKVLPEVQRFLGLPVTLEDFLTQKDTGGYAIGKTTPPKSDVDASKGGADNDDDRGSRYRPGPSTSSGAGYSGNADSYGSGPVNDGGYPPRPIIDEDNGDRFGYRPPPYVPPFGRFQNTETSSSGTHPGLGSFGNFGDSFGFGQDQNAYGRFEDFGDRFGGYDSKADTYATPSKDDRRSYDGNGSPYNDRPSFNIARPPRYDRPEGYQRGVPIYGGYPNTNYGYPSAYAGNPVLGGVIRQYDRPNDRYAGNPTVNLGNPYDYGGSPDRYDKSPVGYDGNPGGYSGISGGYGGNSNKYGGDSGGYGGNTGGHGGNPASNNDRLPVNAGFYPSDTSNYRDNPVSYPANQKGYGLNLAAIAGQAAPSRGSPSPQGGVPFYLGITGDIPPSPEYNASRPGPSGGFSASTSAHSSPSSGFKDRTTNPVVYTGNQASTDPYGSLGPKDERLSSLGTEIRQDTGIDNLQSKGGYGTTDTHTYGNDKIITIGKVTQTDKKTGFSDVFRGQGSLNNPVSLGGSSGGSANAAGYLVPPLPPSPVDKTGLAGVYDRMAAPSPGVQDETTDTLYAFTPSTKTDQDPTSAPDTTYPIRLPDPVVSPAAIAPSPTSIVINPSPSTNTLPTITATDPPSTADDLAAIAPTTKDSGSNPDSGDVTQRAPESNIDFSGILQQLDPKADITSLLQKVTENGTNTDIFSIAQKASESGIDVQGFLQQLGPNATIGSVLQKASEGGKTSNIGSILQRAAESGALGNLSSILQKAPESGATSNIGSILQNTPGDSPKTNPPTTPTPNSSVDIGALVKVAAENGVDVKAIQDQLSNNPDLGTVVQKVSQSGIDIRALQEHLGNNPRVAEALKKAAASGFDIGTLLEKLGSGGPGNLAGLQRLLLNKSS